MRYAPKIWIISVSKNNLLDEISLELQVRKIMILYSVTFLQIHTQPLSHLQTKAVGRSSAVRVQALKSALKTLQKDPILAAAINLSRTTTNMSQA